MAKNKRFNLDNYKKKDSERLKKRSEKIETENKEKSPIIHDDEDSDNDFVESKTDHSSNFKMPSFLSKYKVYLWIGFIFILTFIVFIPALDNQFVNWDDDRYVNGNKYLTEMSWENIKYFFSNFYFVMYIPLTMLSYMIDYQIAGLEHPEVYHIHNVILHLINVVLVFVFVYQLVKRIKSEWALNFAVIVTMMFSIHTLRVESVTWIAERKDVQYAMFYLAAMICYLYYSKNYKRKFIVLAFIFFVLSLLSKAQAVIISMSFILLDYLLGRINLSRDNIKHFFKENRWYKDRVVLEKIPFFVLSFLFGILAILAIGTEEPFAVNESTVDLIPKEPKPLAENLLYASYGFLSYVLKSGFPYHLSAIHPYPTKIDGKIPFEFFLYPIPVLAIAAYFVYAFVNKYKYVVFGMAFFIVNLLLVLQIVSYQSFIMTERYTYMASLGFNFLVALGYSKLIEKNIKFKQMFIALFGVYIFALSIFTFNRNDIWQNSLTLWDDVREKYPQVTVANYNRGNYNQELGDLALNKGNQKDALDFYNEAIKDYTATIKLNPYDVGSFSNRGITRAKIGQVQAALDDFNQVIKLDSTYANIYSNRGNAFVILGNYDAAIADYTVAIKRNSNFQDAYYNRGIAYFQIGMFQLAVDDLLRVEQLQPRNANNLMHLGASLFYLNNFEKAEIYLNQSIEIQPNSAFAYYCLGKLYDKQGKKDLSLNNYRKINLVNPSFIENLMKQAQAWEMQGNLSEALKVYADVFLINPDYSPAFVARGVIKGRSNDMAGAINDFTKAIQIDSNSSDAYTNRGFAYNLSGNKQSALIDFNKAIVLNPNSITAYFNRGLLKEELNDIQGALADFDRIISLNPNYADAYYRKGILRIQSRQLKEACDDFSIAIQLGHPIASKMATTYCK